MALSLPKSGKAMGAIVSRPGFSLSTSGFCPNNGPDGDENKGKTDGTQRFRGRHMTGSEPAVKVKPHAIFR